MIMMVMRMMDRVLQAGCSCEIGQAGSARSQGRPDVVKCAILVTVTNESHHLRFSDTKETQRERERERDRPDAIQKKNHL